MLMRGSLSFRTIGSGLSKLRNTGSNFSIAVSQDEVSGHDGRGYQLLEEHLIGDCGGYSTCYKSYLIGGLYTDRWAPAFNQTHR